MRNKHTEQLRTIVYGAAIGDALGLPFVFLQRDSFACETITTSSLHNVIQGTFSDDTSMLLATCDSIKQTSRIDINDMQNRFCDWLFNGTYTADGIAFDVGNTVASALHRGYGCDHEYTNGNGSLMRIVPLAVTNATDEEIRQVSAITHAHWISMESCVIFVHILRDILNGKPLENAIINNAPWNRKTDNIQTPNAQTFNAQSTMMQLHSKKLPAPTATEIHERFAFLHNIDTLSREEIGSSGYVLETLSAALWCTLHTTNYKDCVISAVNLGDDTDTTACVAGALAAALYGFESIPTEWIEILRGKEIIENCLF